MSWWYCPVCGNHFPVKHWHQELTTEENIGHTTSKHEIPTFDYHVPDGPKMLRETLCAAQSALIQSSVHYHRQDEHVALLQRLIDECDRKRPLYPNGKHGDLHTAECGCEDAYRVKCPQDRRHYLDSHAPGGSWYGLGHDGKPSPWPVTS